VKENEDATGNISSTFPNVFRKGDLFMREKVSNVLWGLIWVTVGLIVFGTVMGFWEAPGLRNVWPLLIIVPSLSSMIKNGIRPVNSVFMVCGVFLLLEQNEVIQQGTLGKMLVPAIFIVIGVCILFRSLFGDTKRHYRGNVGYSATFAGNVVAVTESSFVGCEADAVFGGLELDLRDAVIEDGAVIEASAIFGGIDIMVPEGVRVKLRRTELFGGAKNHAGSRSDGPVLYVNALCMFGGVDIK